MNKEVEKLAEEKYPLQNAKKQAFIEGYKAASSNTVAHVDSIRWVKASERLPNYQRNMIIKLAGEPYVADFQPNDTFLAASFDTQQRTLNFDWFDQIEWLEEQTNPVDNIQSRETLLEKFMMFAKAVEEKAKELHNDPLYTVSVAIQEWLKEQTKEVSTNQK